MQSSTDFRKWREGMGRWDQEAILWQRIYGRERRGAEGRKEEEEGRGGDREDVEAAG